MPLLRHRNRDIFVNSAGIHTQGRRTTIPKSFMAIAAITALTSAGCGSAQRVSGGSTVPSETQQRLTQVATIPASYKSSPFHFNSKFVGRAALAIRRESHQHVERVACAHVVTLVITNHGRIRRPSCTAVVGSDCTEWLAMSDGVSVKVSLLRFRSMIVCKGGGS